MKRTGEKTIIVILGGLAAVIFGGMYLVLCIIGIGHALGKW